MKISITFRGDFYLVIFIDHQMAKSKMYGLIFMVVETIIKEHNVFLAQYIKQSAVNRLVTGLNPVSSVRWPVGETVNSHASHACIHGFKSRTGHHENINHLSR
jgi:hypothetical protein